MNKILISLITVIMLGMFNQSCAMAFFKKKLPETPISSLIDVSKKGNKVEIYFRVDDEEWQRADGSKTNLQAYYFDLLFTYDTHVRNTRSKYFIVDLFKSFLPDKNYTEKENRERKKDGIRVMKLMGGIDRINGERVHYQPVPIPNIRIKIINLKNTEKEDIFYNKILEVKSHPEVAGYYRKHLDFITMKPGSYKAIFEVMSDAIEFSGTKVYLDVGYPYHK